MKFMNDGNSSTSASMNIYGKIIGKKHTPRTVTYRLAVSYDITITASEFTYKMRFQLFIQFGISGNSDCSM